MDWIEEIPSRSFREEMVITEIFKSIQGESTYAGLPCLFVRLTGCNLRCHWCDTAYAFYGGQKMTVAEVLTRLQQLGGNLVELTGGEPLLQQEIYSLTDQLLAQGFRVLIETSGERSVAQLPRQVVKVLDVKCPGSGEEGKFCFDNLGLLERKDQIKFVILNEDDYGYARDFLARHDLHRHVDEVIFSPVFDQLSPRSLAEWILRDNLEVRLGLQIHKFIWGPETRGV
ncbi:7-carboxy-7-deazaguanine synthase [Acidobacteriia bacterium SbA2]|nr:7-carboxy-7-deazaguanine synthase [Acidobacteriia bacterium SbA2]